jgi:anaerobic ribonucleoside-triphosphate reductase
MKMSDTLAVIPSDQLSTIKKEADIAKGFITAVQSGLREKETLVSHFIKELEDVKVRLSVKEQDLTKNLESLKAKIQEEALIKVAQEKIKGIVAWKKTVNTQWVE